MKRLLIAGAFIYSAFIQPLNGFAQSSVDLPAVVPPPADAASLGRYGDAPVNMSIGLPNISVPIYEIKTPRLKVPLSLNYYSSGIKVDDFAGWTGLGWTLDAGGLITRTIRDLDDVGNHGYAYYTNNMPHADTLTSADWQYEDQVTNGHFDTEPDYFIYNFLDYAGKFIFGENGNPILIHYQDPFNIQYSATDGSFTILDGEGNQYLFASKDSTQSYSTSFDDYPSHEMTYASSWNLSRIISFDKSDTISFQYFTDATVYQTFNNYSEEIGPSYTCSPAGGGITSAPEGGTVSHTGYEEVTSESFLYSTPKRLREIDFKNGKVVFFSSGSRLEYDGTKLDSLIVYDLNVATGAYNARQTTRFSYDYYVSNFINQSATGYRLRLDSLRTTGSSREDAGKYTFLYDSTMLPLVGSTGRDLFNYYNGVTSNNTLVPLQMVNYGGLQYTVGQANRNTDPNYIQAGILKHIYYPTGGRSDFVYEPNSYTQQQFSTNTVQIESAARGLAKGEIQMGVFGPTDTVLYTAKSANLGSIVAYLSPYNYSTVQHRPFVSCIDLTANQTMYSNGFADPNNGASQTIPFTPVAGHVYQLIAQAYDDNRVYCSIVINDVETTTTIATSPGGGLRLKQLINYDQSGKFAKSELYKYGVNECGYGDMPSPYFLFNVFNQSISYTLGCADGGSCTPVGYSKTVYNAYNIYDVFNLSAAPLSYQEVAKYLVDSSGNTSGKTVYDFTEYRTGVLPVVENNINNGIQITNSGWEGGKLVSQTDYVYSDGRYVPVKRVLNGFQNITQPAGRGLRVGYISTPLGCYTTGPLGVQYFAFDYPIYTGSVLPSSQVTYDYDQNDTTKYVTTTKHYFYDNTDHLQATRVIEHCSDGTQLLTVNRYPAEVDSLANLTADQVAAIQCLNHFQNGRHRDRGRA